ncbi:TetR/AcrR family transcriptional regulator [Streptomyces olivaceus]|uniref:TetR/AcrR family transcriptional regulator n=1 Tax=Streptomyces olivaceus TaxID=47716 RepID=UPI0040578A06
MTTREPGGGEVSERRRARLRLEISREAARLFWEQGVAATSGDQIAEAAGLPTRTVRQHFHSKESCVEPVVLQGVVTMMTVLRSWPRQSFLEDHLATELVGFRHAVPPVDLADEMLAMKMIRLAETESALRSAWLIACDHAERELCMIIGDRLGRPAGDLEVRMHAAAAYAVVRVLDEHIGAAVLAGETAGFTDVTALSRCLAQAVRTATGGAVGDPVA